MEFELNELINDYNQYITKVENGCKEIVEYLAKENIHEALKMILNFSEGMLWLESVTNYFRKENLDVKLNTDEIKPFLIEINEGLTNQDFMLVSDIFEYEIVPYFEKNYVIEN